MEFAKFVDNGKAVLEAMEASHQRPSECVASAVQAKSTMQNSSTNKCFTNYLISGWDNANRAAPTPDQCLSSSDSESEWDDASSESDDTRSASESSESDRDYLPICEHCYNETLVYTSVYAIQFHMVQYCAEPVNCLSKRPYREAVLIWLNRLGCYMNIFNIQSILINNNYLEGPSEYLHVPSQHRCTIRRFVAHLQATAPISHINMLSNHYPAEQARLLHNSTIPSPPTAANSDSTLIPTYYPPEPARLIHDYTIQNPPTTTISHINLLHSLDPSVNTQHQQLKN